MIRKQIYIEPEQERLLKERAKQLGVSEAELIRRGIEGIGRLPAVLPADRQAWQDELAFIQKRAHIRATQRKRRWTRDEIYDEGLKRFSR